jgi:hypothetical protein
LPQRPEPGKSAIVFLVGGTIGHDLMLTENCFSFKAADTERFRKLAMSNLVSPIKLNERRFLGRLIEIAHLLAEMLFDLLWKLERDSHRLAP